MFAALLSSFDISIPVTPTILMSLFLLVAAIWGVFSMIVRYHWREYGTSALESAKISVIYFTGSGILLFGAAIFLALYSLNAA
ncbi:MAG TPA: hypothetical protein VLB83_02410 [Candidatus Paceibacterota bacterium]|nr:hypothetical protein [Candidatus Paceibacterota bacterium]